MQVSETNETYILEVMMNNNIRSERVRIGASVEDVATAINVSSSSVSKWESGDVEPNGRNLVNLAQLFNCTPDYLLDMTDERHGYARRRKTISPACRTT